MGGKSSTTKHLFGAAALLALILGAPLDAAAKKKKQDDQPKPADSETDADAKPVAAGDKKAAKVVAADSAGDDDDGGGVELKVKKTTEKKPRAWGKFGFGLTLGGGYDSNVFTKRDDVTQAGLGELSTKLKLDVPLSTITSWRSGGGLGGSYRSGDGDLGASAAKLSANVKTGFEILLWGVRRIPGGPKVPKSKQKLSQGRLGADIKYAFSANPVVKQRTPDTGQPPVLEEDPFEVGEDLADDSDDVDVSFDEDDEDDDQADEIDDEADDESAEAEEEDFIEDEVLEGKTFSIEGGKHTIAGAARFLFDPTRGTTLGLIGGVTRGINPKIDGKPSSDYIQFGPGIKAKQKIAGKYLTAKAGYNLGFRNHDEKVTAAGDPISFMLHGITVGLSSKPLKPLKLSLTYRFKLRIVGADDNLDSRRHSWAFGTQVTLSKQIALLASLSFADQALLNTDTHDAGRFQGMLGMRLKL